MKRNKGRTLFTCLSIFIATLSFYCVNALLGLVPQTIHESSLSMLGGDIAVQSYLTPIRERDAIKQIPEELGKIQYAYAAPFHIKSETKSTGIVIKGIQSDYPYYGQERFPEVESLDSSGALIARNAAERLQVGIGDEVSVPDQDGKLAVFKISGIVEESHESFGDSAVLGTLYIKYDRLMPLLNLKQGVVNEAWVLLNHKNDFAAVKDKLTERFPHASIIGPNDYEQQKLSDAKPMLLYLQLVSILTLAIAAITIYNTMTITLMTRLRDIAIMKSIGMRGGAILQIFLTEALLMGLAGTLLGLIVGIAVSSQTTAFLSDALNLSLQWSVDWGSVWTAGCVGLLLAALASLLPIRSIMKLSPMFLLRTADQPVSFGKKKFLTDRIIAGALLVLMGGLYLNRVLFNASSKLEDLLISLGITAIGLLFILLLSAVCSFIYGAFYRKLGKTKDRLTQSAYLGLHLLSAKSKRNGLLAFVLTVGVFTIVANQVFSDNLMRSIQQQLENQSGGNIVVTSSMDQEEEVKSFLQQTDGILSFKHGYQFDAELRAVNDQAFIDAASKRSNLKKIFETTRITIESVDVNEKTRPYSIISGRDLKSSDDQSLNAVLIEDFKKDLKLNEGDTVTIELNGKTLNLTIAGFYKSDVVKTSSIRLSSQSLLHHGNPTRMTYSVLADAARMEEVTNRLNRELPSSAMAYSVKQTAVDSLKQMLSTQRSFFMAVAAFAFISAILMIGNQIIISTLQHVKDLAILKSIGIRSRRLRNSLLIENVVIATTAGVVGTLLAFLMSLAALTVLFRISSPAVNMNWMVWGVGLSVGVSALVSFVVTGRILKIRPLQLLRSE